MDGSSCEERGLISNPFIIPNNLESGVQWVLEKLLNAQHIKPSAKWIIANAMLSKESQCSERAENKIETDYKHVVLR